MVPMRPPPACPPEELPPGDRPVLWVVLDEAVLRRPVGGHAVMREQLTRLLDATTGRHITFPVLPFELLRPDPGRYVGDALATGLGATTALGVFTPMCRIRTRADDRNH